MTPDTIRMIQEGKVFNYDVPPERPAKVGAAPPRPATVPGTAPAHTSAETDEIAQLLREQQADDEASGTSTKRTRKAKLGKTVAEVPDEAAAETSPQTNFQLAQRPVVNFDELIEWLIAHPGASHAEIGAAYGRTAGWFSTVLVMEEFQLAINPRRAEINNPAVTSTIEQRFQALLVRSIDVLQTKISVPSPNAEFSLEVAKLGVRALGLGAAGRDTQPQSPGHSLESLADRLTGLIVNRQKGSAIGSVPQATELVEDVTPKDKS